MKQRRLFVLIVCVVALLALVACGSATTTTTTAATTAATTSSSQSAAELISQSAGETTDATAATIAATAETSATAALAEIDAAQPVITVESAATDGIAIALNGDAISADSAAVTVNGSTATITAAGTYTLSGTLSDGQIVVDTEDEETVTLILNGVDITSASSAPIYVANAEAVVLVLADGSANNLTDAASYTFADPAEEEPSGAVFSNADLTIAGNGALTVTGNYNDAITSDDGLTIESGTITVSAVDDGLRGKDYLVVRGGTLVVNAGGDGLKSDNEDDAALGYIAIENGTIQVTAAGDAIAAETNVLITGGQFALVTGGGSGSVVAADASAKGIKGLVNVVIDGGTFSADTADDAIHSNGNITINGGTFALSSGDDAIHADATVTINNGDINIATSYEGIEGGIITINDGTIRVVASDDGINVAGGVDSSGMTAGPGRGGRGGMGGGEFTAYTGSNYLYINGGWIVVTAGGDGLDANGAIQMSGGTVLVNGPTEQGNGALDYDGGFQITGGLLVAVGSAGMVQAPDASSTQNSALIVFSSAVGAGELVNIADEAGNSLLTFAPSKSYQAIAFSSPELATGGTYTLSLGGSASGTATDGLYDGGYTPGTEYTSFTVSSVVTQIGGGGGGFRP